MSDDIGIAPGGVDVDALVNELIATGEMNAETVADLERIRADHLAGSLHPDDTDYLVAFHARIMGAPGVERPVEDLHAQLLAARQRLADAQAEVARLEQAIAAQDSPAQD